MSFNFMDAVTIYSDFGAPKIKTITVSIVSPSICHGVMGPDDLNFLRSLRHLGGSIYFSISILFCKYR